MILNSNVLGKELYKCKKNVMGFLVYECYLPLLDYDDKFYYFVRSDRLEECIKKIPLSLKIKDIF